jgi:hypothetical protein
MARRNELMINSDIHLLTTATAHIFCSATPVPSQLYPSVIVQDIRVSSHSNLVCGVKVDYSIHVSWSRAGHSEVQCPSRNKQLVGYIQLKLYWKSKFFMVKVRQLNDTKVREFGFTHKRFQNYLSFFHRCLSNDKSVGNYKTRSPHSAI